MPPIIVGMVSFPNLSQYDLSSVQIVVSGAAPLGKETEEQFCKKLHLKALIQGTVYSSTHAHVRTHARTHADQWKTNREHLVGYILDHNSFWKAIVKCRSVPVTRNFVIVIT